MKKNPLKKLRLKLLLRGLAVIDVLFAEKFELQTWRKDGTKKSHTKFWKEEIDKN